VGLLDGELDGDHALGADHELDEAGVEVGEVLDRRAELLLGDDEGVELFLELCGFGGGGHGGGIAIRWAARGRAGGARSVAGLAGECYGMMRARRGSRAYEERAPKCPRPKRAPDRPGPAPVASLPRVPAAGTRITAPGRDESAGRR